jgi:hypothetical protein
MKKIYAFCILLLCTVTLGLANQTRMGTLMTGDYVDDMVNIDLYPNHILAYHDNLYGDITARTDTNRISYGIVMTPNIKYGAFACWQNGQQNQTFNIGYAVEVLKFDIGISGSPVKDNYRYGIGIGRTFFDRRFDLAFVLNDRVNNDSYVLNLRLTSRKGDFVIVPKYSLEVLMEPVEYNKHTLGIMVQRLILNEGFVYFLAEYDFTRGDIQNDFTHLYAGFELPLNRRFGLLLGVKETFTDGFDAPEWQIEPGIGIRIREFTFDFHLNYERLFDKDVSFFKSFGIDLNFGRF